MYRILALPALLFLFDSAYVAHSVVAPVPQAVPNPYPQAGPVIPSDVLVGSSSIKLHQTPITTSTAQPTDASIPSNVPVGSSSINPYPQPGPVIPSDVPVGSSSIKLHKLPFTTSTSQPAAASNLILYCPIDVMESPVYSSLGYSNLTQYCSDYADYTCKGGRVQIPESFSVVGSSTRTLITSTSRTHISSIASSTSVCTVTVDTAGVPPGTPCDDIPSFQQDQYAVPVHGDLICNSSCICSTASQIAADMVRNAQEYTYHPQSGEGYDGYDEDVPT